MPAIKVLVGVPLFTRNDLTPECQQSLLKLQSDEKTSFEILHAIGSSSLFLRNILAAKGNKKIRQSLDYDFFLSVDSDMFFTRENATKLLEIFDSDEKAGIVSAAYSNNGPNSHRLVAGFFKDGTAGVTPPEQYLPAYENVERKVDWVGAGFAMVSKKVFEALDYPFWRAYPIAQGDICELCTEDIGLCMDAKKAGFEILIDCRNRVGHCMRQ